MKLTFHVPPKLECFLHKKKRYKIAVGGRGSGKSMSIADMLNFKCAQYGTKICSMREFQSSIEDSSYSLFKNEIQRIGIPGFDIKSRTIDHKSGGKFRFKGLARSIDSIKSYFGFDIFHIEEGQFLSEESLNILTPTLREDDSEFWIAMNPGSSEDPVSKKFLNFCWDELNEKGYYEDDLHLIVFMNYFDNPMFPDVLELERQKDKRMMPRALYDHIWLGQFNDSIENSLISREWFDACIDAHKVLGFEPKGIKFAAHDPSDTGPDSKGYAYRHGVVVLDVQEKIDGDINEGCDWSTDLAIQAGVDAYTWDCDGMGVGLNRQVSKSFNGKPTIISMFKGSEGVDFPDAIFDAADRAQIQDQKTNKDAVKNKRAQFYAELRKRIYYTYRAVVHREYKDPDDLISFDSSIALLPKLRSELCRIPVKPNGSGLFELYTKEEMKTKFKLHSPNLSDSVMMLMRTPHQANMANVKMPQPRKAIRNR